MEPTLDTNTKILDAALHLFYQNGYEGTTTRAIAEGAGVNEVTLFRNFGSKENIFLAVIERETDVLTDIEEFDLRPTGDVEDDLAKAGERIHHEMLSRAKLVKIAMVETSKDPKMWDSIGQVPFQVLGKLIRYFEEAKEAGHIRDVNSELAAVTFFSFFFRSMVSTAFLGQDVFIKMGQETIREFAGIMARGLVVEG
jgi:AcrR family transcriptional regulator